MDIDKWLSALLQFFVLFPAAASCYLPAKNQMRYSIAKTAVLCSCVLLPYCFAAATFHVLLDINLNAILFPALVPFFFLYRRTVDTDLPRSLAIYVGVCAIETFPAQFAFSFDSYLHPASGAAEFSTQAALFHLVLSMLLLASFAYPACKKFTNVIDSPVPTPRIWYSTVALSSIFLIFNILAIPKAYATLHTGRMYWLFPVFEAFAMATLASIYVLFYQSTVAMLDHVKLKERSQLLEMQAHQYLILQAYMHQTARLRHDFRHSVRLLSSLAEKGDLDSIRMHLSEYEIQTRQYTPISYCTNAALNALFGYYHELAASAQIRIEWRIQLAEPLSISELDMAALFGNLMENAIAACQTVPQKSRYFCLTAEVRYGNMLYIVSTNSFDGKVRKAKDGYRSTKHSGNGIGLASITTIAEKYGGSVQVSNNHTEFFLDVVMKLE